MDENQEILELLSKLSKKVDRMTTLLTKIAKVLHLIPVTEKEELSLQLQQRNNLAIAAKVTEDLDALKPKDPSELDQSIFTLFNTQTAVYSDVVADDFLEGDR